MSDESKLKELRDAIRALRWCKSPSLMTEDFVVIKETEFQKLLAKVNSK